jgi:hypothetical protein
VPSVGGASHSPREFTRWEDCVNGANVLLQAAPTPPWYFTFLPNCPQGFGGFSVMISVPPHDGRVSGPDLSIARSDTAANV